MNVQVVSFSSWSDTYGNRNHGGRPGILVTIDGKCKLIPLTSKDPKVFVKKDALFRLDKVRCKLDKECWLAFGFEVDWDRSKRRSTIRKAISIDYDDLLTKRSNYRKNNGEMLGSPY